MIARGCLGPTDLCHYNPRAAVTCVLSDADYCADVVTHSSLIGPCVTPLPPSRRQSRLTFAGQLADIGGLLD